METNNPISEHPDRPVLPDTLNSIGVLKRREVEARILSPVLDAYSRTVGREKAVEVLHQVVLEIAHQQGVQLAESMGGCTLTHFAASMEDWKKDDAMQMEVLEQGEQIFSFNVTRCRYAELYQRLGIPELGEVLSCNRDLTLIEGFNPQIQLIRTQTIMQGAAYCDFRFSVKSGGYID